MIKSLAIFAALALCACQSCHPIVGPPEPPLPWDGSIDAGPAPAPAPVPAGGCEAACAKLTALGCPEAKPTPKGATCVEVCVNTQGSPVSMQPDCVVHADTCANASACAAIP